MEKSKTLKRSLRLTLAMSITVALSTIFAYTSAMAQTAVGTIINNTVTVTWTGGTDSDTATMTVALKSTAPNLLFVSSSPADLANDAGEAQLVTINYRLTSQANGVDDYTLAVASADTGVSAPSAGPAINGGTTAVTLGASMALNDVIASNVIMIPGALADHGLDALDKITIDGTDYTISSVAVAGSNTELTISAAVTIDTGTNIYEYITFTTTLTTGTLTSSPTTGDHEVTSDAYVTGESTKISSDIQTITVRPATLAVTKTVSDPAPKSLDTVTYTILVENTGSAAAANVMITDPIPAFTIFAAGVVNGGCTVGYFDDTSAWVAVPSSDAAVTSIRFDCGTLAGNTNITVKFDVTIE